VPNPSLCSLLPTVPTPRTCFKLLLKVTYADSIDSAMGLLRFGGTLVCVGIPEGELTAIATAFPGILIAKAQKIVGVAVGDRRDAIETLEFAERGIVKTHFKSCKMDELTGVFEKMEKGELIGRMVLDLTA
jgi:propanol-preferring alcohol dehydrogenase